MSEITMYSTGTCPYCVQAQALLERKGYAVDKVRIDQVPGEMEKMIALTGQRTVPQIFIGPLHIGGFTQLHELEQSGQLDQLMANL